jgi:hypothetical protein
MKIKEITEDHILFDNGIKITYYHNQDCCENVYADFRQLLDTTILVEDFKRLYMQGIKDTGVRLNGYLIPCYNYQNGYYSSDLTIIVSYPDGRVKEIDASSFVEDHID